MIHEKVQLAKKQADGYVIPLGQVNLVNVVTDIGMVGCGAFDVAALNNFGYPAAKVRPSKGSSKCMKSRSIANDLYFIFITHIHNNFCESFPFVPIDG